MQYIRKHFEYTMLFMDVLGITKAEGHTFSSS